MTKIPIGRNYFYHDEPPMNAPGVLGFSLGQEGAVPFGQRARQRLAGNGLEEISEKIGEIMVDFMVIKIGDFVGILYGFMVI